jgi:pimeloyl-ACP methyl ester carboxylesterase
MYEHMPYLPSPTAVARLGTLMKRLARWGIMYWVAPALWNSLIPQIKNLPPDARTAYKSFITRSKGYITWWREAMAARESLNQLRYLGIHLGDKPFLVLFGGTLWSEEERHWLITPQMKADARALAAEMVKASTRGELRIVRGASHTMQVDQPDIVADAIREVVEIVGDKSSLRDRQGFDLKV